MNSEFERALEAEVDRQLKDLPDLAAPPGLIPRAMSAITRPAPPWHSRPWFEWPAGLRAAYLVLTFGALLASVPGWRAIGPALIGPLANWLVPWKAAAVTFFNTAGALANAAAAVVDHLGKGVLVSCLVAVVLAYAACVGVGTAFVRFALLRPRKNSL